jgi:uncharacterized membrane protein
MPREETMKNKPTVALIVMVIFALLGVLFAGISTYDYIAHLDRQVHAVSCSYVPGLGAPDTSGTSGCFAVMMSPYAAVFKTSTWGGIPIALPGLAVFFYLLFKVIEVLLRKRENDSNETLYLLAASLLPLLTSIVYLFISVKMVGEICKHCTGIYVASTGLFVAALAAYWFTRKRPTVTAQPAKKPWGVWAFYFLEGVAFVLLPIVLYLWAKPIYSDKLGNCGKLLKIEDTYGTRVKLQSTPDGVPAIEVLDPLCPACKVLHERLWASGLHSRLDVEGALFPLDAECNWMISKSVHPGACAVSEALLCAKDKAPAVLQWAFAHNVELRSQAEKDPQAVYQRIAHDFPSLASCVNSPEVKARLNKALRWLTSNSLPILTPQLYVQGKKICDEDIELGLEYTLTRLLNAPHLARVEKAPRGRD